MSTFSPVPDAALGYYAPGINSRTIDSTAVEIVRDLALPLRNASEDSIRARVHELRSAVQHGGASASSTAILNPAFALVIESFRRTFATEIHDHSILAGFALSRMAVIEMQLGEARTFAAAFPAFVHALSGRGVDVMTLNVKGADDAHELLEPVLSHLGLTVGRPRNTGSLRKQRPATVTDITCGSADEFRRETLRDQIRDRYLALVVDAEVILSDDYVRQYDHICGMSENADDRAEVIQDLLGKEVVRISSARSDAINSREF